MIVSGNAKLGRRFWSFSLAAVTTCPGSSGLCRSNCYARGGLFDLPSVRENRRRCYEASKTKTFVAVMTALIRRHFIELFRLHVEGDFYSRAYAAKWTRIAQANPGTTFLAYTRSWRLPGMIDPLTEFGRLPNVRLWFSADAETGRPPRLDGVRGVAYMSLSDGDLPDYPVDLVFRDNARTVMKFTPAGDFVCPYENGVKLREKITCSRCRYCVDTRTVSRREGGGAGAPRSRSVGWGRGRPRPRLSEPTMFGFLMSFDHLVPDLTTRLLAAHDRPYGLSSPPVFQPTYYLWNGLGAVVDLDGDDGPHCLDRFAAKRALAEQSRDGRDWTLWERVGPHVRLVAAFATDPETAERGIISCLR